MTTPASFFSTLVPGLDPLLGGGIPTGSLALIIGPPGAGKTVLASQIVFAAARQGIRTLVLTAYSEGHVKYLSHLRPFAFFDENLVGEQVMLLSLQTLLTPDVTHPNVVVLRTIRSSGAQVVLLDGFQGLENVLPSAPATRAFLASLAAQMSFLSSTMLVTLAGNARAHQFAAELTTSDLTIGLDYGVEERRHMRRLEVVKQRGQAPLPGLHTYTIGTEGIHVYPRIEIYPKADPPQLNPGRAPFGLPELDRLLSGGLSNGTSTILSGAPGVGKTILALHWALNDVGRDARVLIVTFREFPEQLAQTAEKFGLKLGAALEERNLQVLRIEPVDLEPDIFAGQLLGALVPGVRRLVIDDMGPLLRALGERAYSFLPALRTLLYGKGVTSLLLLEIDPFSGLRGNLANAPAGLVAENVIVVQQTETNNRLRRILAVLRMRFSDHDTSVCELVLTSNGLHVLPPDA